MTGNQLVRSFVLRTDQDVQRFTAFMQANRRPMAQQGRFLQVVVSEYKESRSKEANAYMWAGILTPCAEQAYIGGTRFKAEVWNEYFKELFLPEINAKGMDKWMYLPAPPPRDPKVAALFQAPVPERRLIMSTTHLNKDEMALYLTQIAAHAADELGVLLPANPREF